VEGTESFEYDAIGNLTKHTKPSGLTALEWNAYGKVRQVTTSTATMTFGYDAQQNRLKKTVNGVTSYYIRDAQGNTLAVYERSGSSLKWKEQDLYGSSRLGMAKPEREMTGFFWASAAYTLVAGAKSYELSNHLGNVMAVISDRGELQSAQDFYPFGMAMPGRSSGSYRYTFNGKETDPETGIQDYGMRWYLPNLARFPSVDPLTQKYPWYTPYQFAFAVAPALRILTTIDLTKIPGIHESIALQFLAEVGRDMTQWQSSKHFAAWLNLAPNTKITGGKVISSKIMSKNNPAGQLLRQAASTLAMNKSPLGNYYRRMKAKLGGKGAVVATAHKLARIIYHLLRHQVESNPDPINQDQAKFNQNQILKLEKRLEALKKAV
jgi:RHS repeat-associated protein